MARPDEIRELLRRERAPVEEAKREFWLRRRGTLTARESLRIVDELRAYVHAVRPDWPSEAERAADLASHLLVAETLRRASAHRAR